LARLAEALARLWHRHGEFGQFLDDQSGDIVVGNSTAGGLVPAGLALAGEYLQRSDFVDVAAASGDAYYDRWTARGVTVGGPGEILATPDSESAMAVLESFVTLYEVTGDRAGLPRQRPRPINSLPGSSRTTSSSRRNRTWAGFA
jgi:hypothetical protein